MPDDNSTCKHEWTDEYAGTKCRLCGLFYPHGCAPWDEEVRDGFDFGDGSDGCCHHGVGFDEECEWCYLEIAEEAAERRAARRAARHPQLSLDIDQE